MPIRGHLEAGDSREYNYATEPEYGPDNFIDAYEQGLLPPTRSGLPPERTNIDDMYINEEEENRDSGNEADDEELVRQSLEPESQNQEDPPQSSDDESIGFTGFHELISPDVTETPGESASQMMKQLTHEGGVQFINLLMAQAIPHSHSTVPTHY
jgi:hypothetical protein